MSSRPYSSARFWLVFSVCCGLALCGMYLGLTNGSFDLSVRDVFGTLLRINPQRDHDLVIFEFRLPRIVIGALVGCGLGVAAPRCRGSREIRSPIPVSWAFMPRRGRRWFCLCFLCRGR